MTLNISKHTLVGLFCAILLAITASCSDINPAAEIATADSAISSGDQERARSICSNLIDKHLQELTATQLAHISLIYMQLVDSTDDGDAIARAARCWSSAMALDADSTRQYYMTVPVEQQRNVVLLTAIVSMIDRSAQLPADDSIDSLAEFPADIDFDPENIEHTHD